MIRRVALMGVALALAAFSGCASRGVRVDPSVEAVASHDFNPTDLQMIGDQSVAKLLAMNALPEDPKPFVYVAAVRNLTDEHINSNLITEYITAALSASGKVRLSGYPEELEEAIKQLEFQQGAFVDPSTARKIGKMQAAAYFLQGELNNLVTEAGRMKGQYFQFSLKLVNIETLETTVSFIKIQKVSKKGWFGW